MQKLYYNNETEVKEMITKKYLVHAVCLVLIIFGVTTLSLYQVFVTADYQRVSIKNFLQPKTFLQAMQQIPFSVPGFVHDRVAMASIPTTAVFALPTKFSVTLFGNILIVTNMATQEKIMLALDPGIHYQLITMPDEKTVILAARTTTWKIMAINIVTKKIETLRDKIVNPADVLIPISPTKQKVIAFAECAPWCEIVLFDLEHKKEVQGVPAFTNADKKPSLSTISLDFFDADKKLFGYHGVGKTELYVIDSDLNLLQDIRLENERNTAQFLGYFPQTQQLLFRLSEKNGEYDQLALYAANRPSLHLLQKIQPSEIVEILPDANGFVVGDTAYSLNGEVADFPEPNSDQVIRNVY